MTEHRVSHPIVRQLQQLIENRLTRKKFRKDLGRGLPFNLGVFEVYGLLFGTNRVVEIQTDGNV